MTAKELHRVCGVNASIGSCRELVANSVPTAAASASVVCIGHYRTNESVVYDNHKALWLFDAFVNDKNAESDFDHIPLLHESVVSVTEVLSVFAISGVIIIG